MSLTVKQKGAIMLHLVSHNDMVKEKWVSFFKTKEYLEYALKDCQDTLNMVPLQKSAIIKDLESILAGNKFVGDSQMVTRDSEDLPQGFPPNHVTAPTAEILKPDNIITNMGEFKSLLVLQRNLTSLYPSEKDLEGIIKLQLVRYNMSNLITYLSEPHYTDFLKSVLSVLDNNKISMLGGVSFNPSASNKVTHKSDDTDWVNHPRYVEPVVVTEKEEDFPIEEYPWEILFDEGGKVGNIYGKYKDRRSAMDTQKALNASRVDKGSIKYYAKKRVSTDV